MISKQTKLMMTFVFAVALMASFASAIVGGPSANGSVNGSVGNDSQLYIQGGTEIGSNGSQDVEGRMRIMAGSENGQGQGMMNARFERGPQGGMMMHSGNSSARTDLNLSMAENGSSQGAQMRAMMSNGQHANIKVMPHQASETALEQLRLRVCSENCTIELKEVEGSESGERRAAYEVQAEKQARVLGLFKTRMDVSTQVDAESGETTKTNKPWWAFLASETDARAESNVSA